MLLDYIFRPSLPASSAVARDSSRGILAELSSKARQRRKRKGKKKKKANGLPSHLSLRTLKKPAHEAVQLIPRHAMLFILFSSNAFFIGYSSLPLC